MNEGVTQQLGKELEQAAAAADVSTVLPWAVNPSDRASAKSASARSARIRTRSFRASGDPFPETYVPDLDLRMGLYRRLGELDDRQAIDEFAAELIDRFGALPSEIANLMKIVEVKLNCKAASVAKLDIGPKGAVVTFAPSGFADLPGLLGYIDRLKGSAKLRPDSKMTVSRDWPDADARLNGALQLSRGLARVAAAGEKKEAA